MLSGGGDRGAYEVGAMAGLVDSLPPDQTKWHVVAGANTGERRVIAIYFYSAVLPSSVSY